MTIIETYYTYARLAMAAYIDLSKVAAPTHPSTIADAGASDTQQRMPHQIGEQLFGAGDYTGNPDAWTMLSPYYRTSATTGHSDPDSGFAAMVLSHPGYGKVLAITGTEPGQPGQTGADLFDADIAQIGFLGAALNQIVSLFNYVQVLQAPANAASVLRLELVSRTLVPPIDGTPFITQLSASFPPVPTFYWLEAHYDGVGQGVLATGERLTVTGHSLGGHLAAIGVALFPDVFSSAYTFNAPGYNPPSSLLTQPLGADGLLSLFLPYGASPLPISTIADRIVTLESEDAIPGDDGDGVAGDITGAPFSPERYITTEKVTHDIGHMMDGLALQALMSRMSASLTPDQAGEIIAAAAALPGEAYEQFLERMYKAIKGTAISLERTEPSWKKIDAGDFRIRSNFYQRYLELEIAVNGNSSLQLVSLADKSFADLNTLATNPDAYATRFALRELNPFAVLGADYSRFNQNGELDLFDPATGQGMLTPSWIEDRAKMLAWLMDGNLSDRGHGITSGGINWQFMDMASGQAAYALSTAYALDKARAANADPNQLDALFQHELTLNRASRVVFGGDEAEIINGGGQTDRLYGGGGDDVLHGAAGADYLEGDAGHDVLIGGTGHDIYAVGGGSGTDIIVDAAEGAEGRQLGEIRFGDTAVAGTFTALDAELKNFTFTAADGQYYASYSGSVQENLAGTLTLWRGDSGARVVQVQNFRSGDLGIVLGGGAPPRTYTDIVGTGEADNDKLDLAMPHEDTLVTTAGAQKVFGLGGADYIVLAHAHTIGYGGAGNDRIIDSTGAQSQYGEDGDDVLLAGAGNDELFGGAGNDALQGGADDDLLDGGDGQDFIDGGIGADVIFGGAGADFILGGGNLTYELKVSFDYYRFATGAYAGLSFADGHPVLPHLVGVDPWTGQYVATGYAFYEGDLGDVIDAGEGDDWVFSGDGADSVLGGSGADYLVGGAGDDYIDGGEDADTILGDGTEGDMEHAPGAFWFYTYPQFHGRDVLSGGGGNDYIRGDGGSDLLFGDDGDDELVGDANQLDVQYHGDDYLDGGAGNDRLFGQGGDDQLVGGDGDDILMGDDSSVTADRHGNDYLDGGAGADLLVGAGGADFLFGGDGDDTLAGDADDVAAEHHGDDYLDGGAGNDYLRGYGGNDTLIGGEGNDELYGEAGNDILVGGPGADLLDGGVGDDTYVFDVQDLHGSPGAMSSVIQDAGGANTLILEGMDLASVSVTQGMGANGNDLVLTLDDGSRITIGGGAAGAIQSYGTGDGALLAPVDFLDATAGGALNLSVSRNDAFIAGGRGDDHLIVNGTGNTIAGGKGNDLIEVGGSNNTVDYRPGDGVDTLRSLAATGTRPGALTVSRVESQSPRYGDDAMSNDFEWRKAA